MNDFNTGGATNLSRWVLLVIAAVALAGCGGEGTKENAPATAGASASTPTSATAQTSEPDESTSESAPLPTPGVGNATISWSAPTQNTDGSALTNLAGYRIYFGTNSTSLSQSVQVGIGTQTYVVENLARGTWYFSVKAYTSTGVESDNSNLASKTIA